MNQFALSLSPEVNGDITFCFRNLEEKCVELLDRGLDINSKNPATGETAFITAKQKGHKNLKKLLAKRTN